MSETVARPTFEHKGSLFLDIRITARTQQALSEWKDMLEADGITVSNSGALEDMCLYALSKWKEEPEE